MKNQRCPQCNYTLKIEDSDFIECKICDSTFKTTTLLSGRELFNSSESPLGNSIEFRKEGERYSSFSIPRRGIHWTDILGLLFATHWVIFNMALFDTSSYSIAFLSIAFMLIGIFIWRRIIIEMTERQEIILESDRVSIIKKSFFSNEHLSIYFGSIKNISLKLVRKKNGLIQYKLSDMQDPYYPTIFYGTDEVYFAKYLSLEEMEWLIRELKFSIFGVS